MAFKRDQRLSLDQSRRITKSRTLGQGAGQSVYLDDGALMALIGMLERDICRSAVLKTLPDIHRGAHAYYDTPIEDFLRPDQGDFIAVYLEAVQKIPDFETLFECLCEIHKRRVKYHRIKSSQPLPEIEQISPRAILEFGMIDAEAQRSWLIWRKWLYDLDNRAAQETGYLFEPIMARALGGEPYDAKTSPIRREGDDGKGRQVDCINGRLAYEFKVRLTDAPSGRGRINEEMSFASDCQASGFIPVLLVLQNDASHGRVEHICDAYRAQGGAAYVGEEAWAYLQEQAGEAMTRFIDGYIRRVLEDVSRVEHELMDLTLQARGDEINISLTGTTQGVSMPIIRQCPLGR